MQHTLGPCVECKESTKGLHRPIEVDKCSFCQNVFHCATENGKCCKRFQATTRQCEDCIRQLVQRQAVLFKHKDQPEEEFVKLFREHPEFESATSNVPTIDSLCREDRNREMIAAIYFHWSLCNRPNCNSLWGKKSFKSFECCPNIKYCSEMCHSEHMISHMQRIANGTIGTGVRHCDPEAGVFLKGHCANQKCVAEEKKTYRCQNCHLVTWCSKECEHMFGPAHYTRCCKKNTPLSENGTMKHVM